MAKPSFDTLSGYLGTSFIRENDGLVTSYGNLVAGTSRPNGRRWTVTVSNFPVTWNLASSPATLVPVSTTDHSYTFDFTPVAEGDYSLTLEATNTDGTTSQVYTIGVGKYPATGSNQFATVGPYDQWVFNKDSTERVIGPAFVGNSLNLDGVSNPVGPGIELLLYSSGFTDATPNFALNVNPGPTDLGYGICPVGTYSVPVKGLNTASTTSPGYVRFNIIFTIIDPSSGSTNITRGVSDALSFSDTSSIKPPSAIVSVGDALSLVEGPVGLACSGDMPLAANCGNPPPAIVGVQFTYRPPVLIGTDKTLSTPDDDRSGALLWSWNTVPPGLAFDQNPSSLTFGYLTGIPTAAGSFSYGFTVTMPAHFVPPYYNIAAVSATASGCPLTVIQGASGGGPGGSGSGPGGNPAGSVPAFTRPSPGPNGGMGNCIFEFYGMETPEDVEVLPVPKKYDQLGPVRFDKIGKIFAFRVRLIMNGTTAAMPYAIWGDDSQSSPHLNNLLFQGSFDVRPGIDNVYEIQLPKSVNTDIFRLTLGPVADSFHRYDITAKVHTSGMKGQAKWIPVR